MTEMEKSKYVRTIFRYQNLIPIKIWNVYQPYSEAQIANLSDRDLVKYYIKIELCLEKRRQEDVEKLRSTYANKDTEIDPEPFENESLNMADSEKDTFLGPEYPSPHAQIIEMVRQEVEEKSLRLVLQKEETEK